MVRSKFNISISETDNHVSHQDSVVSVVMVNSDRKQIEKVLDKVEQYFEMGDGLTVMESTIEWL